MKRKPMPVNARVVFIAYAVVMGALGITFLIWGPAEVRMFAGIAVAAAGCAAGLGAMGGVEVRKRSLFWFAAGHIAVWLLGLAKLNWTWGGNRPLDHATAVAGTIALALFWWWFTAEGEWSTDGGGGFFGAAATSREQLRSQYEQKIRQAAAQEERNRLARDLHDSVKQQIFAIQTAAATAQTRFDGDSSGAREALDQIRSAAREAMTEMEVMLDQLRAEPLESTGLVGALKKLCESIGFRTGAQVEFKLGGMQPSGMGAPGASEATLRVAQEALANVARHARASRVVVTLDSTDDGMELTVEDNGAGFDPGQDTRGMGTANMRSRAEELGGRLELISRPEAGTTVKFSVPASAPSRRYQNRNRAILVALMICIIFLNGELHHWSLAPALAFVAVQAAMHYWKLYHGVRRLSQPVL